MRAVGRLWPGAGFPRPARDAQITMESLTQCWFTRVHRPVRERHREDDGSLHSTCRYCHRPLVTWDHENWNLATGFDVSRLAELTSGRTLTLIDTTGDLIIRRFPVRHLETEEEVDAYKAELRAMFNMDDPDSTLILRDSAPSRRRKTRTPPPSPPPDALPGPA